MPARSRSPATIGKRRRRRPDPRALIRRRPMRLCRAGDGGLRAGGRRASHVPYLAATAMRMLYVARRTLHVVCCTLHWCTLHVACCLLHVARFSAGGAACLAHVVLSGQHDLVVRDPLWRALEQDLRGHARACAKRSSTARRRCWRCAARRGAAPGGPLYASVCARVGAPAADSARPHKRTRRSEDKRGDRFVPMWAPPHPPPD